jgi:hypothetical protein
LKEKKNLSFIEMSNFEVNESTIEEECDMCMEMTNDEKEEETEVTEEIEKSSEEENQDSSESGSEEEESSSEENSSEEEKLPGNIEEDDKNQYGLCEDKETIKNDKEGSNCPTTSFFQSIIDFLRKGL